jgi:hypothetical protein
MKKLFLTLCLCVSVANVDAQTNVIFVDVGDYGLVPVPHGLVTLTLVAPKPRTYNGITIQNMAKAAYTDANGIAWFTNIIWGEYTPVLPDGTVMDDATVATNTLGLVNIATLIPGSTLPPDPSTLYYTQAQIDAQRASGSIPYNLASAYGYPGGGSGGSATNAQPPSLTLSNIAAQVSTPLNVGGATNFPALIATTNSPFFDGAGAAKNATNGLPSGVWNLGSIALRGSNDFYLASNPSGFVTSSITNGLATINYVNAATNQSQLNLNATNTQLLVDINTASNVLATATVAATNGLGNAAFQNTNTLNIGGTAAYATTSVTATNLVGLTNTATFYVDVSGNDATAQIGRQDKKWNNFTNAWYAATNFQALNPATPMHIIFDGTFDCVSNLLPRLNNVVVEGVAGATWDFLSTNYNQNSLLITRQRGITAGANCFMPVGNNSVYKNFGIVQIPSVTNGAALTPIGEKDSDNGATNALLDHLWVNGIIDCFLNRCTNGTPSSVTIDSCTFVNFYDTFNTSSSDSSNSVYRIINPNFYAIGFSLVPSGQPNCIVNSGAGTVFVQGGFLVASNENDGTLCADVNQRGTGTIWVNGTRLVYSSTNGVNQLLTPNAPATAVRINLNATGLVKLKDCTFDPAGASAYCTDLIARTNNAAAQIYLQNCVRSDGAALLLYTNDYNAYTNVFIAGGINPQNIIAGALPTTVTNTAPISDTNLSSNVPLKNGANTFPGTNTFGTVTVTNTVLPIKFIGFTNYTVQPTDAGILLGSGTNQAVTTPAGVMGATWALVETNVTGTGWFTNSSGYVSQTATNGVKVTTLFDGTRYQ